MATASAVSADPLAELLHELQVGCDWEFIDRFDAGMGSKHKGDHEADAKKLRAAIWLPPTDDDKP